MNLFDKWFKKHKADDFMEYSVVQAGDMVGSFYRMKITPLDEQSALITIETQQTHNEEMESKKYRTDRKVIIELVDALNKIHMQTWSKRKMNRFFVCDGANTSYSFNFKNYSVRVSSQMFPTEYQKKLQILKNITEKYMKESQAYSEN